ncbi:nickel transporter permease NikB [Paenibacillus sp. FSL R7-0273]|uniref:nickel/cobalt ABC transporter permease n=1 Tax=Paenibacillus sp. FSL R7-0273 TaxID=1536772 RepID=UPI0004F71D5B|nr:nickel/cobalt ABC transporter permease [Paenibacillus sp. FSL R7-0273]AIQ47370.1 nickel transporter permease NikB [Paenibacillus sp. FSL R7-0273]OMF96076.1 nickel ABC transporter permease subunit NikB [Paenibacillus sp. FSL R7-0273]
MGRFILKRTLLAVPLLIIISFLTFGLNHLSPMDPAEVVLRAQGVPQVTEALLAETKAALGMDRPFLIRYFTWLASCFRLDFGESYITGTPVWALLGPAFMNTLKLTMVSVIAILAFSVGLGILCALREGRLLDRSIRGVSFFLTSMPSAWLAALMIWFFSVKLDLLPTSGLDSYASYILPVIVLTVSYAGIYFRLVRSAMLSQLHEDYTLYARACGLQERKITLRMLKNSMQVATSVFCMAVPIILGSTVVVESIFAWPGLGSLTVNSILGRDFPVIQAYVLVLAVSFVLFNTLSDLINAALDPKLRKEF